MAELDYYPIALAAEKSNCTPKTLLIKAMNQEILLYARLKPHSATLASPLAEIKRQGNYQTKGVNFVPLLSHIVENLYHFDKATIEHYQADLHDGILNWHYWHLDEPQEIVIDDLFLFKSEFQKIEISNKTEPKKDLITNKTDMMAVINQASMKFWNNAKENEPDTWEKNQAVVDWLIEKHNFSKNTATTAATIIRPEWAKKQHG